MQDINNKLAALLETLTDFFQNFVDERDNRNLSSADHRSKAGHHD